LLLFVRDEEQRREHSLDKPLRCLDWSEFPYVETEAYKFDLPVHQTEDRSYTFVKKIVFAQQPKEPLGVS